MPEDVHPQIQGLLHRMAELGLPKVQDLDTRAARELLEGLSAVRRKDYPPPEVLSVEMRSTGAGYNHVPLRIYRVSDSDGAPVILFYHGGGHVIGSLDSHDAAARFLAWACGATVVSVDYRMAPEHPFPAAVEDAYEAARYIADHAEALGVDATRLALCGDSAGGNLAAVVALMARDREAFAVTAQALVYPVVDCVDRTASYDRYGEGYGVLEADTVSWFMDRYLPDPAMRRDWHASPIRAELSGLPPTFVLTAECDVLHDEGVAFAAKLKLAGVEAEHREYPGMIHGFFTYLGQVDAAQQMHQDIAAFLKANWG
ncbi:alpha/beta hydrolase [Sedimentitalea arenosa]|uniref:Alpha/beta hydrolase n=1 Tax=Sedimentitalea arenosa TaxID=2798803 RepID=A0A8J7LZX7_9RHOB|nr:alpha/beta hydrolase [Arenibacterium arenosum]MBJ6372851.1 alpha/beta hydrolase [Arenibacterium arenosum]